MVAEPQANEARGGNDELNASPPDTHNFPNFVLREKSRTCKQKFKECLDVPNLAHEDWLEQRSAEFNWWTSGLNADKNGPGSLDARLRLRPDVTAVIVDALDGLDDALSTYHDLATSEFPLSDEEDPPGLIEADNHSTNSDGAHRAPSPWSDMSSGSRENPTCSIGNGDTEKEETEDAESQPEDMQSISSSDIYAEQRVYIENNLEVLIRIHTAIKLSGLKLRNKRADDALRQCEREYERQKLELGAHEALAGRSGAHERFRRYLTKLVLRNGYTEDLMRGLSFRIYQLTATEDLRDQNRSQIDDRLAQSQTNESYAMLLQTKIMIVLRAYLYDSARLTTVQRRLINANVVRRNRMVHAGAAGKAPSHVREERSRTAPQINFLTKSIPQRSSLMTGNITPSSSNLLPSPPSRPVTPSKQGSQTTKSFVAQPATALESNFSITGALKPALRSSARSAGTKMSARVGHLDYPSCSAKEDGPFPCDYCPMILPQEYKKKEKWRGHVAQDLCGYVCVFEDCKSPEDMFASTYEWMSHMARFHSEFEWVCPMCAKSRPLDDADDVQAGTFHDPSLLKGHILAIHPASDATADPDELELVASAGQRTVGIRKVRCPLCRPGLVTSEESNDDSAMTYHPLGEEAGLVQLEEDQHVATHIHEFALHAFPSPDGEDLSNEAGDSVSSQPSTRVDIKFEGPQLAEDSSHGRQSAYSLEDIHEVMEELYTTLSRARESDWTGVLSRVDGMMTKTLDLIPVINPAQEDVDLDGVARGLSEALALASQLLDVWLISKKEWSQITELLDDLDDILLELPTLFEAGRRIGKLSTGSPAAPLTDFVGGLSPTSPGDDFFFPKPEDSVIDDMFLQLMQKRGWDKLPEQAQRQMLAYPFAKKWTLIHQDRLAEWQGEQKRPITPWQIIHMVECGERPEEYTYYLETPWVVESGPVGAHLSGSQPISNYDLLAERETESQFSVYIEYLCCDSPLTKAHGESRFDLAASSLWRGESIGSTASELRKELLRLEEVAFQGIAVPWNSLGSGELLYPYVWFFHRRREIQDELNKRGRPPNSQLHLHNFREYIKNRMMEEWAVVDNLLSTGRISPEYMEYLIIPGDIIISKGQDNNLAQITVFVATYWPRVMRTSPNSMSSASSPAYTWKFDGCFRKTYGSQKITIEDFPSFSNPCRITDLPIYPSRFTSRDLLEALRQRGREFWKCRSKRYVSLHEDVDDKTNVAKRSRFMIDMSFYNRVHAHNESGRSNAQAEGEELEAEYMSQDDPPLGDEFFMCLPPSIPGFNMRTKEWVDLDVCRIREVKWNTGAFDSLLIDPNHKNILLSLLRNHRQRASEDANLIAGKGKGLIILLHGPPGTGKTLTAESLAETSQMPLYKVTGEDIGTEAAIAERNLEAVLTFGKEWGCVVLIDEADYLLEQRSDSNLQRNAVVSVFLRILEDYDGVLILTSNADGTFDDAFRSRIHLDLRFEIPGRQQRVHIWRTLLQRHPAFDQIGLDYYMKTTQGPEPGIKIYNMHDQVEGLAAAELNYHQIEHAILMAQVLAGRIGEPMGYKHLHFVVVDGEIPPLSEVAKWDRKILDLAERYKI